MGRGVLGQATMVSYSYETQIQRRQFLFFLLQLTNHKRETFFNSRLLLPPSYYTHLLRLSFADVTPSDQYFG